MLRLSSPEFDSHVMDIPLKGICLHGQTLMVEEKSKIGTGIFLFLMTSYPIIYLKL